VKILDRYLIRAILPPFVLALGMFTFLLAVNPMLSMAKDLLAKGVDLGTVGFMLVMLLPQALGVTLPMALLAGLLMALGRLSGDRESVALLACGVSPVRLLRPVMIVALGVGLADLYVMTKLLPDANQQFRIETYRLIAQRGQSEIKPGVFYEGFPGKVLFIREILPDNTWAGVFLGDTSQPGRPSVTIARSGFLDLEPDKRQVSIVLTGNPVRYVPGTAEGVYDTSRAAELRFAIPAEQVFGDGNIMLSRGRAEMTWSALRQAEAEKIAAGNGKSPEEMFKAGLSTHPEVIARHQMLSFPVSCLVFAILGVVLGLHTRREGKLAGFTLGLMVIASYNGVMVFFENLTKGGDFPAEWARWVPNIVFGLIGIAAMAMRNRNVAPGGTIVLPSWMRIFSRRQKGALATSSSLPHAHRSPARPVVVIRIPELNLPVPRILDRYVASRYLSVGALSFTGLLTLYYIVSFIDRSDRLFKGQASAGQLAEYFLYSTPQFIVYLVPTTVLVAVLATIGALTRTGELTVMRACGVSLYRVAAPLLLLALAWGGGLFLIDDRVLGHANKRAATLEDEIKGVLPQEGGAVASANWIADRAGRFYYFAEYREQGPTMRALSIFEPSRDGSRLASHTLIPAATFVTGETWRANTGWVQRFPAVDRSTRQELPPRTVELLSPDRFSGAHAQTAEVMSFGDLSRHIADLSQSGVNLSEEKVRLQARLAFPLVTIVMTLIGVPFGVSTGRHGALYGVGLAIILGASYWLVNTFFLAAGAAGLLAAPLAAWAANLLFLAVALYAVFTVRT
jgi:LPS export ABC transporter permease LptG/LPS export ABC transporter permease LptF